jgi:hypothetical protein
MGIFYGFKNKALIETTFPCETKYKETQVASLSKIHTHNKKTKDIDIVRKCYSKSQEKVWVTLVDTLRKGSIITYRSPIYRENKTFGDDTFCVVLS